MTSRFAHRGACPGPLGRSWSTSAFLVAMFAPGYLYKHQVKTRFTGSSAPPVSGWQCSHNLNMKIWLLFFSVLATVARAAGCEDRGTSGNKDALKTCAQDLRSTPVASGSICVRRRIRMQMLLVVAFLSCSAVISGVDGVCVEWTSKRVPYANAAQPLAVLAIQIMPLLAALKRNHSVPTAH